MLPAMVVVGDRGVAGVKCVFKHVEKVAPCFLQSAGVAARFFEMLDEGWAEYGREIISEDG
jgi:hypothetical protein